MKPKSITRFAFLALLSCLALLMLTGCSEKKEREDKDKDHTRTLERATKVAAFNARVRQLHDTLNQLERDLDIQRSRIAAARGDLEAIHQGLYSYQREPFPVPDTTATQELLAEHRSQKQKEKAEAKAEAEKETLNRLLILLFAVAVAGIAWWVWRSRERDQVDDGSLEDRPWETAQAGLPSDQGYVYPTQGPPPATPDRTPDRQEDTPGSVPPDTQKNTDESTE